MLKKILSATLTCALCLTASPVFAQAFAKLMINGQDIPIDGCRVSEVGENTIVPLRLTAEKLGFAVTWDGETKTAALDNNEVKTTVTIGKDAYYLQSSRAIGLTAPMSLGYAPTLIDGRTYVPAKLYELLFSNQDAVRTEDDTVFIDSKAAMDSGSKGKTEQPNPMKQYDSAAEAQTAAGFTFQMPQVPSGYAEGDVFLIGETVVQITYSNGTDRIAFRVSRERGDISGDYNQYEKELTLDGATVKGNGDKLFTARFEKDGLTYSIGSVQGLTCDEMSMIVQSL